MGVPTHWAWVSLLGIEKVLDLEEVMVTKPRGPGLERC